MKDFELSQLAKQAANIQWVRREISAELRQSLLNRIQQKKVKGCVLLPCRKHSLVNIAVRLTNGLTIGLFPSRWDLGLRYADMAILHFAKYRRRGVVKLMLEEPDVSHVDVFNTGEKNAREDYAAEVHVVAHLAKIEAHLMNKGAFAGEDTRVSNKQLAEQITALALRLQKVEAYVLSQTQTVSS